MLFSFAKKLGLYKIGKKSKFYLNRSCGIKVTNCLRKCGLQMSKGYKYHTKKWMLLTWTIKLQIVSKQYLNSHTPNANIILLLCTFQR